MEGFIFDIKPFAVHDGPGIRTTVFLKGCSLKCKWCHNPEGINSKPQLSWAAHKCTGCGNCVKICPEGVHGSKDGVHTMNRTFCSNCGKCTEVCFQEALKIFGRKLSPEEALKIVLRDAAFYENSGGGVTVSGGEPLLQSAFIRGFFALLKKSGIHTAVDTSAAVPVKDIENIMEYTDLFLCDFKHNDPAKHLAGTGMDNFIIKENLRFVSEKGNPVEIRIPLIPGYNDDEESLRGSGEFLKTLKTLTRVVMLPYHDYARTKYAALDMEDTMPVCRLPDNGALKKAALVLQELGINAVSGRD